MRVYIPSCAGSRDVDVSPVQYRVLKEMYDLGSIIVTTEGTNYKAWLQNGKVQVSTLNRNTASVLLAKGWIVSSNTLRSSFPNRYCYELSDKAKKLFK